MIAPLKHSLRTALMPLRATRARAELALGRPLRFSGAFADRAAALASLPKAAQDGYDNDAVAEVSFEQMCDIALADYPVLLWLSRLLPETGAVLDAGGHLGTKYLAFRDILPLEEVSWTVYDLPAIVAAGHRLQAQGRVPERLRFIDNLAQSQGTPLLLASGLLQYLDTPLSGLISQLPRKPRYLLLNKVALRDGPGVTTLERIGPARVPYQIRNRAGFLAELTDLGYTLRDSWTLPELGHEIRTHPWLGRSTSWGGLAELTAPAP